jgi:hypothetical protein
MAIENAALAKLREELEMAKGFARGSSRRPIARAT